MKKHFYNTLIFFGLSLIAITVYGIDFGLPVVVLMNVSYWICYPIVLRSKRHTFAKKFYAYPIAIGLLSLFTFVFCRVIYIPIVTFVSKVIGKMFPVGHFGYSAFFIFAAVNVILIVLIVYLIQRLYERFFKSKYQDKKDNLSEDVGK